MKSERASLGLKSANKYKLLYYLINATRLPFISHSVWEPGTRSLDAAILSFPRPHQAWHSVQATLGSIKSHAWFAWVALRFLRILCIKYRFTRLSSSWPAKRLCVQNWRCPNKTAAIDQEFPAKLQAPPHQLPFISPHGRSKLILDHPKTEGEERNQSSGLLATLQRAWLQRCVRGDVWKQVPLWHAEAIQKQERD